MKKIKILGIGNEKNMNYLIVKKQDNFFNWLSAFLSSLGRISSDVETYEDFEDNYKTKKKDIKNFVDTHEDYHVGNTRIDVFYGKDKVFISFYCTSKERKTLMDKLEEVSKFVKYKDNWKLAKK